MSNELSVRHLDGDRFAINIRGHQLHVDQPTDAGGEDTAPTPTELFIAGLASCVAFYARRYLARHNIDPAGLAVAASFTIGGRPTRVTDVAVRLTPPPALPAERRDAFYAAAAGCTVHHTFEQPPAIAITLTDTERDVGTNDRGGRAEAPRILTEETVPRQRWAATDRKGGR
jgi:putative redox protein